MQTIADSGDKLKRNRGRRGLDVAAAPSEQQAHGGDPLRFLRPRRGAGRCRCQADEPGRRSQRPRLTNDFNLNKVASLRGVDVININDLANALKPVVLPGERMTVRLLKPGESPGQGVGYLVDGTMVVVEQGRPHLNEEIEFTVTSVLQTSAGKMIFGRLPHESPSKIS